MKLLAAIVCLLFSLVSLFFAVDASGSLQDAPPTHTQQAWTLPYSVGSVLLGALSIFLFVKTARRGL